MGERRELGGVVGEDTPGAPGAGALEGAEPGVIPVVLSLVGGDAPLGAGSPLDHLDERGLGLDLLAGEAGFAVAHDGDEAETELGQFGVDRRLP